MAYGTLKKWISKYTDKYDECSEEDILSMEDLNLENLGITDFPLELQNCQGGVYLSNNKITSIPKNYHSNSVLYLSENKIKEIPKCFIQKGLLILSNNKIKEIPREFVQTDELFLNNNLISSIPKEFIQKEFLDLTGNPLNEIEDESNFQLDTLYELKDIIEETKRMRKVNNKKRFIENLKTKNNERR